MSTSSWPVVRCTVGVRVLALVGIAMLVVSVTANGQSAAKFSGKSPKPLPKSRVGVQVLNESASTPLLPVPPTSTFRPNETMLLWSGL